MDSRDQPGETGQTTLTPRSGENLIENALLSKLFDGRGGIA